MHIIVFFIWNGLTEKLNVYKLIYQTLKIYFLFEPRIFFL